MSSSIKTIRAVGNEGQGNAAAAKAWKQLIKADAAALPRILGAMDGANPLAANWLRSAVDTIVSRDKKLPVDALKKFLKDKSHDPRARRLAFELIQHAQPDTAAKLIPSLINDPSVELRRDAVQQLIDEGIALQKKKQEAKAKPVFRKALDAARDIDQIKVVTTSLRQLKEEVDLPRHFGFLMHWQVIGPFDNTDRSGFAKVYPPEKTVKLDASYKGKANDVKWGKFITADEYGKVDINKAYPGLIKEVTAYAYTTYNSAEAREVQLRLGCKNAWKIWVNDKLIFGRDEYHRGTRIDHYQLNASFKKGKNTILIKLCQNEQTQPWTKEWEFQMRVCDPTGTALLASNRPATPTEGTNNSAPAPQRKKTQ
ncbi:MAG: HEAT repeat domain-containing protein [Verrucomicrobiota bacterium]|nr:HEAT repeat domain-containing protein [Verrucomicrobiota bacterium]